MNQHQERRFTSAQADAMDPDSGRIDIVVARPGTSEEAAGGVPFTWATADSPTIMSEPELAARISAARISTPGPSVNRRSNSWPSLLMFDQVRPPRRDPFSLLNFGLPSSFFGTRIWRLKSIGIGRYNPGSD